MNPQAPFTLDGETVHQLGNQLGIVLGFVEILLLECSEDHPHRPELVEIRSAAAKATALLAKATPR
ncbi:MAG: hypothetical protein AB7I25_09375 [Vicinamibacterales bacterium]